jgi:ABC-2 type transport system permease protein
MRIAYLLKKEVTEIVRQKELVFLILIVPLLEIIILGYVVATEIRGIPVDIIDLSGGRAAREIGQRISSRSIFHLRRIVRRPEEALEILKSGRARAVVTIRDAPAGPLRQAGIPEIQILVDGTDAFASQMALGALNDIIRDSMATGSRAGPDSWNPLLAARGDPSVSPIKVKTVVRFNPDLRAIDSQGPGLVGLLLTFVTSFIAGLALVREKEQQTLDTLLVSRLRPIEIFIGKSLPAGAAGLLNLLFGIPLLMFWFKVPFRGSVGLLLLASIIYLAAIVSLALAYSALSSTQQQVMFLTWYTIMTIVVLSGFFTPLESIPSEAVLSRAIAAVNPFRYLMRIVRSIMLKGGGLSFVLGDLLMLSALCVVFSTVSYALFRRSLKR